MGRPTIAPLLRPHKEPVKELGLNRQRWSDAEDDSGQLYGDKELEKYLEIKGLPHWNRTDYKAEAHREPFPEANELVDRFTEKSRSLAQAESGRFQLPWMGGNNTTTTRRRH